MELQLPTGLKMMMPPESFLARVAYISNCDLDWGSEALFFKHLDQGGDFLDAGANIGYYSLYGAPIVRRVLSFEPDPRNHRALEINAHRAGNVEIHKVALSSQSGEVHLDISLDSSLSKISDRSVEGNSRTTITVTALTIDQIAENDSALKIAGIKLDTEGHELPILRGGMNTIQRDQPLIVTELQRGPGEGLEAFRDLAAFTQSLEYQLFAFVQTRPGWIRAEEFRLLELDSEEIFSRHGTKMIFLVPARLSQHFIAAALSCKLSY